MIRAADGVDEYGYDGEPMGTSCERCGADDLEWIHTGVRWRLFGDNGKPHQCVTFSADDFPTA